MDPKRLLGIETDGDRLVKLPARHWDATKHALWRCKYAWEIVEREAKIQLARCKHIEGCEGKTDETKPCLMGCPDREMRLSALVFLGAARQFAPIEARKLANGTIYIPPGREHFSEIVAELLATQAELETLRGTVVTAPSPNEENEP